MRGDVSDYFLFLLTISGKTRCILLDEPPSRKSHYFRREFGIIHPNSYRKGKKLRSMTQFGFKNAIGTREAS